MDKKIVYAYLVADILHYGHILHLKKAMESGDYLIVGILSDEASMEKKPRPIISLEERMETIKAIKYVDRVIVQNEYSPMENIKKYLPDVLIESSSHAEQPANEFVESYGGIVVETPYYDKQSSSKIKDKVKKDWNK